jgi:hypothetical protein
MRVSRWIFVLVVVVALAGCTLRVNTDEPAAGMKAEERAQVQAEVGTFVLRVADDVTREGPLAWKKEFQDGPQFFMASEGQLAFRNGQEATQGIESFAKTIKNMELHWGDDLRVDALTPELASVGTTWKEVRVDVEGKSVTQGGYFTGLVEKKNKEWRFRDAHWSLGKMQ